jgi:hypothetical protein
MTIATISYFFVIYLDIFNQHSPKSTLPHNPLTTALLTFIPSIISSLTIINIQSLCSFGRDRTTGKPSCINEYVQSYSPSRPIVFAFMTVHLRLYDRSYMQLRPFVFVSMSV